VTTVLFRCVDAAEKDDIDCPSKLDEFSFDIFELHRQTSNHSLVVVGYCVIKERGLIESLKLNQTKLLNYLKLIENGYVSTNPYHNSIHAADAMQTVHVLLSLDKLSGAFDDLEILSILIAAAGHDVGHPGLNNNFLIQIGHDWAVQFKNESPLENHHWTTTLKFLENPDANILSPLTKEQQNIFKTIVTDAILATDMAMHNNLTTELKFIAEVVKKDKDGRIKFDKFAARLYVLKVLLHLGDISNPTKPIEIYRQWVDRIMEEFWAQGDKERALGLKISPMYNRYNTSVPNAQIGFMKFVIRPFLEAWAKLVYPDAQSMLEQLQKNIDWYQYASQLLPTTSGVTSKFKRHISCAFSAIAALASYLC